MTSTLQENLTGIRVVRAFARQEHEKGKFEDKNSVHRDLDYRLYKLFAWYWSISDLLCMGQMALIVTIGGYWLATGQLLAGTFFFFLSAVNMFIWPVRQMGRVLAELGKALVAIGRIGEILNHPRETGPPATRGVPVGNAAIGEVVFDRVSFSHGDVKVLDSISFRAEPGQTLALLGPSGSGKSTIVNLLLRFYDPDEGTILLDGRGIVGIDRKEVRSRIAVVMQEPFLYSKTLQENIRLGRSTALKGEITEAASTAGVHEAILEFDDGYATMVGERGVTLSGGQRQRVALARAVLDRASVLVLDDAFSAVDTDTEIGILDALRRRNGRQTTLLIAHRLSTLMHADWILVLDKGRIIQQGPHESLAAEDGLYRRLWKIQSSLEEEFTDNFQAARTAVVR
jgi:ATP-binding cassette subfamily B protein